MYTSILRLIMEIKNRFFNMPKGSFFLFGPRGTGKSTLLRMSFPTALVVDLLDPEVFRSFSARPELLEERIAGTHKPPIVVIDEIQKTPDLLPLVHRLIERKMGLRFALTGSSARKLKRSGVDLLAGRAVVKTLHPFMAAELQKQFHLERALRLGMLPLILDSAEPEETLRSYAALYVKEEVQAEGLVRHIGNFSRFLEAASFSHAAVLNVANVARECQVERKVVEGYLSVLEDLLLAFRLDVFSRKRGRELASHPKFYYCDTGVYRSLRPKGALDRPEEIEGAALEGLVAQHLRAWIAYSPEEHSLYHWRTRSGVEVDFVVYGAAGVFAIEVKNTSRIRPEDLRSLKAFGEEYPQAKRYLLYRGKHRIKTDQILCAPCEDFLLQLAPGRWPR